MKSSSQKSKGEICTLIEMAPDGIVIVDAYGMIMEVNNSYTHIFGFEREEMVGKKFFEFIPSLENRTKAQKHFLEFQEVDSIPRMEFPAPTKTGEHIPIEMAVTVLKNDIGKFTGTMNIFRDISKQKEAEEGLFEIEQKFRLISESPLVGMAIVQENQITYANEALSQILEIPKIEIMDLTLRNIQDFIHPLDEPFAIKQMQKKQIGEINGLIPHYQFRIVTKTNKTKWLEIFSNSINYKGKPADFITMIDITIQKLREEELKQANIKLKDFASIVSHDLKAPLRGIAYLSDWIAKDYSDIFDAEGRQRMSLIRDRVKRMDTLVDGILHYSLLGQLREERVNVDLKDLIEEIIDLINPPNHIKIEIMASLPIITCKRTHIAQVFQNLLDNATKFMDKPQGLIKVQCTDERDHWKFSITDNGPGIDEKYFKKIFQIFQTLAPRDKVEGTGIGLALCKKIIEEEEGNIWLESSIGKGSTFYFTLPKLQNVIKK